MAQAQAVSDLSIIWYSDSTLEPDFEARCQRELRRSAGDCPIVAVSQKPTTFADVNICVGPIGRSLRNLFLQPLIGVLAAQTKYVAMAEHDCFYSPRHFAWRPPDDGVFWYDCNHWFVSYQTGQYAWIRRKPMSMLICARSMFLPAVTEKLDMLEKGFTLEGDHGLCEPGVIDDRPAIVALRQAWWASVQRDVGKEPQWTAKGFYAEQPSLDIRYGGNYSGNMGHWIRRARRRTDELPQWGAFKDYWANG